MECELCGKDYKGHAINTHKGHHESGYIKADGSRNWDYSERSMRLKARFKAMRVAKLENLLKLAKMS